MDVFRAIIDRHTSTRSFAGVIFGVVTHLAFLTTVWFLFAFLSRTPGRPSVYALEIDLLLATQFAFFHSLWLCPPVREWLKRWISRAFYGCLYCLMTCLSLWLTFSQWRVTTIVVWSCEETAGRVIWCGFLASWLALFYSLALTGLGYQTGFTEWFSWLRGRPVPSRTFAPRGAYLFMRHPVYLSFMALLWFVPTMTLDHLLLSGVWTVYIFVGSWLKDRRLAYYLGDRYRQYASEVTGYPLALRGPMAKWTSHQPAPAQASTATS